MATRGSLAALLVLGALLTAACGDDESAPSGSGPTGSEPSSTGASSTAPAAELDGKTYTSTSVTGHDLVAGTQIELAFEAGVLAVSAGCNLMSAQYAVEDGSLRWTSPAASTMKACPEELMAQDAWLATLFTDGVAVTTDAATMTLTSDEATIELTQAPATSATQSSAVTSSG